MITEIQVVRSLKLEKLNISQFSLYLINKIKLMYTHRNVILQISNDDVIKCSGFHLNNIILDAATIQLLRNEVNKVFSGITDYDNYPYKSFIEFKENDLKKFDNVWWINSAFRKIAFLEESAKYASKLMC